MSRLRAISGFRVGFTDKVTVHRPISGRIGAVAGECKAQELRLIEEISNRTVSASCKGRLSMLERNTLKGVRSVLSQL